jgi:hypothetical protein
MAVSVVVDVVISAMIGFFAGAIAFWTHNETELKETIRYYELELKNQHWDSYHQGWTHAVESLRNNQETQQLKRPRNS